MTGVNGQQVVRSCTATYTVESDISAPTCPTDWAISHDVTNNECIAPAYQTVAELEAATNGDVFDECTDDDNITVDWYDTIVPLECSTPGATYFDTREVIRTYTFEDECGNTSELCPQTITYNITECNELTDYGTIAINNQNVLEVPEGCDVPLIGEVSPVQGGCGYVEYMWLVSIVEQPGTNQPYIPNDLNVGPGKTWQLVPGATEASYDPAVITQNTYYVRCARDLSCCGYGESNLVGYRINNANQCPVDETPNEGPGIIQDCEGAITLTAQDNNALSEEELEYQTNMTIEAGNTVGAGSNLIYNAKTSTTLMPGFEVKADGVLEVKTDGCPEND